jgi:hypothetical protein
MKYIDSDSGSDSGGGDVNSGCVSDGDDKGN